jgi:hypothetical protein
MVSEYGTSGRAPLEPLRVTERPPSSEPARCWLVIKRAFHAPLGSLENVAAWRRSGTGLSGGLVYAQTRRTDVNRLRHVSGVR